MLAKGWGKPFLILALAAVCSLTLFPVFWLVLTSVRPQADVFYVWRGTSLTLANLVDAWKTPEIHRAFLNSALVAVMATVVSIQVTFSSGYLLSRFRGKTSRIWFVVIYLFRTIPYITWTLPLYFLTNSLGIYDSLWGVMFPHVIVHICFFTWVMKGFFDGIDPALEEAAYLDGCSHWGAMIRIVLPMSRPAIVSLGVLSWLYSWNEFMFALLLAGRKTPFLSVKVAQFVHEMGIEWHLMSATAVLALGPAVVITFFAQKYIVRGFQLSTMK